MQQRQQKMSELEYRSLHACFLLQRKKWKIKYNEENQSFHILIRNNAIFIVY